jgi:Zn-dependent protease with chaperone function
VSSSGASHAVRSANRLYRLHLAVAGAGLGMALLAVIAFARSVSLAPPPNESLLAACCSLVPPELAATSILLLLVSSLTFAAVALGVRAACRRLLAQRRFLKALRVAGQASVGVRSTVLIDEARPQAFCAGLLHPRVYISTGALEVLGPDELDAVLAHEAHHVHRRDPLRILIAGTLAEALFFLPALRRLSGRYEALSELAADQAAVAKANDRRPLARALLAFDGATSPAVVGIAPERVDHLLGERPRWELPSALFAATLVVLVASGAAVLRVADASSQMSLNLPLLAAQACTALIALAPPVLGAVMVVNARAIRRRSR